MRPPEFTGGKRPPVPLPQDPSEYCFNEAAGIHRRKEARVYLLASGDLAASMRPPEFTGGKHGQRVRGDQLPLRASMRPPEFTGGKYAIPAAGRLRSAGFNEAAGIHRRKVHRAAHGDGP